MNFYNEHDPRAAAWLRELIAGGHIAPGVVDERCISEIKPDELHGYTQCHFFAGIGGWSLALRLAGWPDDRAVWTGSCPCQPFSGAGKGLAEADPRHLWPVWFPLIRECAPAIVFGEQVASKAALGWLDGVFADLEGAGYACGAADLCAAGVGAPHIRQRLFWVADAAFKQAHSPNAGRLRAEPCGSGAAGGLGDADRPGLGEQRGAVAISPELAAAELRGDAGGLADAGHEHAGRAAGCDEAEGGRAFGESARHGAWGDFDRLPCRDGKARRVESGTFPLAHGVSGRVGLLRGYGNAIVPQVAAEFVSAFLGK